MYFPLIVHEALMVEPTETESRETLDEACDVFLKLWEQAHTQPQSLHDAPVATPVGRLDEVGAARHPVLRYQPMIRRIFLCRATGTDPHENLALEQYLLEPCGAGELHPLPVAEPAHRVLGRNQNAWQECRCAQLEADGGFLAGGCRGAARYSTTWAT